MTKKLTVFKELELYHHLQIPVRKAKKHFEMIRERLEEPRSFYCSPLYSNLKNIPRLYFLD
ncbi:hypothetical protein MTHERMMSTA1_02700 [Methanosarcina thermophila MST-A1]|uniref:Uncharacterized protein n=1 Tax=Methanosarcina thermophila TaxID=2210 RepID=A0A3G9CT98_METTE|nr:conserved hypothetical protein [Methanosarcina thermophila]GLI13144.1 hypothetical protein MTHERMMSTA1_02700 [Methanosarcina thermophila MST-A1]